MSLRDELVQIYEATIASMPGDALVRDALSARRDLLPRDPRDTVVISIGKVAGPMAYGAVATLGPCPGIAVGPVGTDAPGGFEVVEGEHPTPGPRSIRAGIRLLAYVDAIRNDQTALVLLSGGASALAEALAPGLSLLDVGVTIRALWAAAAPIADVNTVRKHLSRVKGGKLAAACGAGRIVLLAISDVEGDDLSVIGSGPFSPDPTTPADALDVIARYGVEAELPPAVLSHLRTATGVAQSWDDPVFDRVHASVIAGPEDLRRAAILEAQKRGFRTIEWPKFVRGDVEEVAREYLGWLRANAGPRTLLVASGEPTVLLPSRPGSGGRAQQLALLMAETIEREAGEVAFLAAGSDGRDGLSDHAGAVVDSRTAERARSLGFDIGEALQTASSAAACEILGASIPAQHSETNLTDLHLVAFG